MAFQWPVLAVKMSVRTICSKGAYSFVFGSPESLLQKKKWRNMLHSNVYQDGTFAIVVDEVHAVPKW